MAKNFYKKLKKYIRKDSENFKKYVEDVLDYYGVSKNLKELGNVTYINTGTSLHTEVSAFFEVKTISEYSQILNKKFADDMYKEFNLFLTTRLEIFTLKDCFRCTFTISQVDNFNTLSHGGRITEDDENSGLYVEE